MKKVMELSLGLVTSIGGFIEAGSLATSIQAGAGFGFQLIWALALGVICLSVLIEMSGRLAAVRHHPLPAAVRERFGVTYYAIPFLAEMGVDYLVLASEIGGVCLALQLLTGVSFHWWAIPVAFLIWLLLWKGTFSVVEQGVSILGLITLAFVVAAFKLGPEPKEILHGLIPTLPKNETAHYWFLAVSILGASISPYLLNFYSSGGVEDKWDESYLPMNRVIAGAGIGFGGCVAAGVIIVAALTLRPHGIHDITNYEQAAGMLSDPLGRWGYWLFAASLFIGCLGAALEINLDSAYVFAQTLGWNWGENPKPVQASRFSFVYTILVVLAAIPVLCGLNPLKLTMLSMALTVVILPLVVLPFLVLMNDPHYVGKHTNGRVSNAVVAAIILMAFVVAIVAIPLELIGG